MPTPHVEKSSHACRKTLDHLHAVKPVIDYSFKGPHVSSTHQVSLDKIYGNVASKMYLISLLTWYWRQCGINGFG